MALDAFFWSFPVKTVDFAVFGPRTRPMLSGQAAAELLGLGKPERGRPRQEAGAQGLWEAGRDLCE